MKKILITGGAGFIGSNLCEKLVSNKDNFIYCLDNLYTGRLKNIKNLLGLKNFKFINHDIIKYIDLDVDEIYNLACPASPIHYQSDSLKTLNTSIYGMLNILELAKNKGAKVLQASTSEIYGDPFITPQKENYWGNVNPVGIRSCYDEGKRCSETYCMEYNKHFNIPVKIIRIFNTYGPNMNPSDGRVISNFIWQALNGNDITIYGNGSQTRSFQYIDDLIEAMILVMNTENDFTGPINLGNPNEFTIKELALKVINLIDNNLNIIYTDLPEDDPKQRKPDITLAKNKLNWNPKIELEEGLLKTYQYFLNEKK